MLEQLSCSVGFHQCNHLPLAREVDAMQQFKAFKAIVEATAIEVIDEFAVAGELAVDVGEGSDHAVELHGKKAGGPNPMADALIAAVLWLTIGDVMGSTAV